MLNKYGYRIDKYARGYTAQELGPSGSQAEALCGADANDNACGSLSFLSYTVPAGAGGTYQLRAGCAANRGRSGTVVYTVQ